MDGRDAFPNSTDAFATITSPTMTATAAANARTGRIRVGSPASALKISAAPAAWIWLPKESNVRPVPIWIDCPKLGRERFVSFRREVKFVFCTDQGFLVVLCQGFADGVGKVCRDALDLPPAKALDCRVRQVRRTCCSCDLLFGRTVSTQGADG
jgi:hypothetical protein